VGEREQGREQADRHTRAAERKQVKMQGKGAHQGSRLRASEGPTHVNLRGATPVVAEASNGVRVVLEVHEGPGSADAPPGRNPEILTTIGCVRSF
jgi:hypothetical protein